MVVDLSVAALGAVGLWKGVRVHWVMAEKLALYSYRAVFLDSVHRFIPVNTAEYALLQTPFLRRLHDVRQLGFVFLVFPSAKHSRFEHTLGVMHVAGRIAERLLRNGAMTLVSGRRGADAFVELARLAGLVHDLGHPPYSHTLEKGLEMAVLHPEEFGLDPSRVPRPDWSRHGKYHEFIGERFASELAGLASRLRLPEEVNGEELAGLLEAASSAVFGSPPTRRALEVLEDLGLSPAALGVVSQVISHRFVDADRIDYLIRDAYNTGVVFGYIDIERLLDDVRVVRAGDSYEVTYGPKSIPAIEDLYDARFKMYRSVYLHHKVVALATAIIRVLRSLFQSWAEARGPLAPGCLERPEDFLDPDRLAPCIAGGRMYWDDSEFNAMLRSLARMPGAPSRWAKALTHERRLLPISLVKRPDRIVSMVAERVGPTQAPEAIEAAVGALKSEGVVSEWYRFHGVDRVEQDAVIERITHGQAGEKPHLPGGSYSLYLEGIIAMASAPLPFVYAFSEDERSHLDASRLAGEARRFVEDWIVGRAIEVARRQ